MTLLDTDVFVDIALDRRLYSQIRPRSVWTEQSNGAESACIAWHSVSHLYYLVTPSRGGVQTRDFIVQLTRCGGRRRHRSPPVCRRASNVGLGRCYAGSSRPGLRGSVYRDTEHQRLCPVSDPCGQPGRGAQRTVLKAGEACKPGAGRCGQGATRPTDLERPSDAARSADRVPPPLGGVGSVENPYLR